MGVPARAEGAIATKYVREVRAGLLLPSRAGVCVCVCECSLVPNRMTMRGRCAAETHERQTERNWATFLVTGREMLFFVSFTRKESSVSLNSERKAPERLCHFLS